MDVNIRDKNDQDNSLKVDSFNSALKQNIASDKNSTNKLRNSMNSVNNEDTSVNSRTVVWSDSDDKKNNELNNQEKTSINKENEVNKQIYSKNTDYNFRQKGSKVETSVRKGSSAFSAVTKIFILMFVPLSITVAIGLYFISSSTEEAYRKLKKVVLSVPMRDTNWQDLGVVFEPLIEIPVKTENGYERSEFLLDSGAVVSSLPREWVEKTGQDLAFMKRSTFRGFGGATSFAYQGEMTILLNEEKEVKIPAVFTEAMGTKALLGRKGFFEDFSVYFNHREKRIEIRE